MPTVSFYAHCNRSVVCDLSFPSEQRGHRHARTSARQEMGGPGARVQRRQPRDQECCRDPDERHSTVEAGSRNRRRCETKIAGGRRDYRFRSDLVWCLAAHAIGLRPESKDDALG